MIELQIMQCTTHAKRDTFAFDSNMLSSSPPEESHESPPEWLKEETLSYVHTGCIVQDSRLHFDDTA